MSTVAQDTAAKPVFSPIVAIAMVAVGALSLLFYIVFAAYAPDLSGESDGRTNVMSRSAIGFAGLAAFLKEQGIPVLISRGLGEAELSEASLIIETPGLENDKAEVNAVTRQGPKLVILPKWFAFPDPIHPGWVRNAGIEPFHSLRICRDYRFRDVPQNPKRTVTTMCSERSLTHATLHPPLQGWLRFAQSPSEPLRQNDGAVDAAPPCVCRNMGQ